MLYLGPILMFVSSKPLKTFTKSVETILSSALFSNQTSVSPGTNLKTLVSDPLSGCVNETDFENGKRCTACKDGCVNAACLPTEREAGGRACWIAGWGITTEDFRDGPPTSKYLRKHF